MAAGCSDETDRLDWLEQLRRKSRALGYQWDAWSYLCGDGSKTIRGQIDQARGCKAHPLVTDARVLDLAVLHTTSFVHSSYAGGVYTFDADALLAFVRHLMTEEGVRR